MKTPGWLLLLMAIGCASCKTTPRADGDRTSLLAIPLHQSLTEHEPSALKLRPGDRIEATVVRMDYHSRVHRVRAVVQEDGTVEMADLGRHQAAGKTTRRLEQELLRAFNDDGQLRGTVRVVMAPAARDGFFITPTPEVFHSIINERRQAALLNANQHPKWRWMRVTDDAADALAAVSTIRNGQRWTLAAPAHPELIGERLAHNIGAAWTVRESSAAGESILLELNDSAAVAMESVAQRNGGRRVLLVIDEQVVDAPMIESVRNNHAQLSLATPGQKPRVLALFEDRY